MHHKPPAFGLVDLARIAGVSPSTVSRALAGNPRVAAKTREMIARLAEEHDFKLNPLASALKRGRTGAIGVVIPLGHEAEQDLSDPFFMALLAALADSLSRRGHDLLLSRVIPESPRWLDRLVDSGRCDGLILIGQSDQFAAIDRVAERYANMVVWGQRLPGSSQITVGTQNKQGGCLAAEHLIRAGRRRLAFLGNPAVPEFAARLAGFRQAIAQAGTGVSELILPVHLTTQSAYQEIAAFLTGNPPPDGIVAASDVIAMSAMQALAERALAVPDDVAVIGYDDIILARYATPPLTTVRQDVRRGAEMLVDLLERRMSGEAVESVEMEPELVIRGSA